MDVNLEAPSGDDSDSGLRNGASGGGVGVSDEALILKIGGKGPEEGGAAETELRGDRSLIGMEVAAGGETEAQDGAEGMESGVGEKEVEAGDLVDKKWSRVVDDDMLEDVDVDNDESVVQDRGEDGGEGVKEVVTGDVVDKKWGRVVDDDMLEDVDVDIDDSGDVQAVVLTGGNEVGNGSATVEDGGSADKMGKGDEMAVDRVGASRCEEIFDDVGKMERIRLDQDGADGEPVSGKSGASRSSPHPDDETVGNLVGESEDEEVDIGGHEPNLFTNQSITTDEKIRSDPTENVSHSIYQLPAGKEGTFSVSDMVWGKVRSHPWWPGQIFDPSKASEIAMKHHKKDCYLVAFFGDRTFAWSEASQLKHFRAHFPHVEKQGNSEALHHAISCALEEVSRRVELGLACQCIQTDVYEKLRYQDVENTGIQEEASRIESTDESASAYLFEPCNLLRYIKSMAQDPSNGADQLELVIAKAQLSAFYRRKGYYHLPEYQFNELSLNSTSETVTDSSFAEEGISQTESSLKRKHNMRDIVYTSKRDRSMDESILLMGEDFEYDETFHSSSASLLSSKKQNSGYAPKQSFKIGDCIVRAASQLTGSPGPSSFLKSINEKYQKVSESTGASRDVHAQLENHNLNPSSSVADDMLSQHQSMAPDPTQELNADSVGNNSISPDKTVDGRNTKAPKSVKGSPEAFEFEDMKDSYWTDRVIQNGGEEKPERKLNYQVVTLQPPASLSRTPRVHSRKRYSNGSHKIAAERPISVIDKSKQDMLPAELILNFPDINSIPSEGKLNNMFRRFGPLKEFETEVDRESNRARVVFKRASDAEVAFSSCEKFNIFGSYVVRYELSYTPSVSYKAARIPASQGMETVSLPEIDFATSTHDLEFITMQELEDATMQDLQYSHHHDLEGVTMQDLGFTTTHDLEFPESQDLDIVSTNASEDTSIQVLDVSAQAQHPAVSEIRSSKHLEFKTGENMIDGSGAAPQDMEIATTEENMTDGNGAVPQDMEVATTEENMTDGTGAAPQDMEIATAEDQQQANQDSIVKTPGDLESGRVQEPEAVTVQQDERVVNPETAGGLTSVDTNGPVEMDVSAQDADNSLGQDVEVAVNQDVDAITIGEEKLAKDHESVSGELLLQDKGSTDKCTNSEMTGLQEPEVVPDDPMILSGQSDQRAEQGANLENETILSNQSADQETDRENDSNAIQERQVALREDDPVEVEMLAPDVDATEDIVTVTNKDAAASETEDTEVTASGIKNTSEDVETTKQDAPDFAKEAPEAELTHDDNVEINEPQTEDSHFITGAEGMASVQNDVESGVTKEEADEERDLRMQDSKEDAEGLQEAT